MGKFKQSLVRFWRRFWAADETNQPLVEVVRAATVDPQIRNSLLMILRMERNQRKTAIQSLVTRLSAQQAPEGLISALGYLKEDQFADATLKVLENDM